MSNVNAPQLQEEVWSLRCQLEKAEKLDPARNDILAQDLAEAIGSQAELAEQLQSYREDNEQLHQDKQTLLDQKESLSLQVQQLSLDCSMHEQKAAVIQEQMRELREERQQALPGRDEAQPMINRILTEKDSPDHRMAILALGNRGDSPSQTSAPPFLLRSRPKAIRINGRVLTISFHGEDLLKQLSVVGGNKTGVFVHQVTEDSAAHMVGISPGAQIVEVKYEQREKALRMVLEDSTLEEAVWALSQVTGFCHLSLRPRPDVWSCSASEAKRQNRQHGATRQESTVGQFRKRREPRAWLRHPDALHSGHATLPPVCRPILLLPSILGRVLDKKLAGWEGFQLLEPETLNQCEHAARLQKSEILEECEQPENTYYTTQSVQKVMKKVFVFGDSLCPASGFGLCAETTQSDIYPIIIYVGQSARSAHKLRSKLHRYGQSEEQLLACSRSEEPLLDKLPCLYHSMAPDSWCDYNSLLTRLRTVVWEEQKKIVWVEPDLL
ncbi:hypothetical protein WMY93_006065 [Mugilogobius chulae]|uniref:Uncharacterized protein n=1 Tax=Mugilogobius chulae TaxID=88201 RepID=A0AAW0PIK7_9GOBI